jgi:hypothetical protein
LGLCCASKVYIWFFLIQVRPRGPPAGGYGASSAYQQAGYGSADHAATAPGDYSSDYYAAYANYYSQYGYPPYGQEQTGEKPEEPTNHGDSKAHNATVTAAPPPSVDPYYAYYNYGPTEAPSESNPLNYDYSHYALSPEAKEGETMSYDH